MKHADGRTSTGKSHISYTYFIHVVQYCVPCRGSPLCECWCERAFESCTNMNNLISCLCSNYKF